MCWRPRESSCEDPVAYLVRSLRTYARIRSLTTGTFNLIVKDRTAIRLSGAHSVQPGTHMCDPAVLETLQTYRAAKNPVNPRIPQNFHGISTVGIADQGSSTGHVETAASAVQVERSSTAASCNLRATVCAFRSADAKPLTPKPF